MRAITNPTALESSREVRKAVAPDDFVMETMDDKDEIEQFRHYVLRQKQEAAEKATEEGRQEGRQEGREQSKQILSELKKGKSPQEVADKLNAPIDLVIEWRNLIS